MLDRANLRTNDQPNSGPNSRTNDRPNEGLVEGLREQLAGHEEQIRWLRREVERKDAILLRMAERIPELEAPLEPPDAPEMALPRSDRDTPPEDTQEPVERRSWWRRFFGFE